MQTPDEERMQTLDEERMQPAATVEERIADIARRQLGLVTRAQVISAGVSADTIHSRVRGKRLLPVQRGVYQVGPISPARAREMAAILACGPRAVISHRSAAAAWGLCDDAKKVLVDITMFHGHRGRRPGIRVHRVRSVQRAEVTKLDGVPITTVPRTILDLASDASAAELVRLLAVAARKYPAEYDRLPKLLKRHATRPGVPMLRRLLGEGPPALTRSEAEHQLLDLIGKALLPRPAVNARVGRYEVDFLWRAQRLIVEVDGFAFHASRRSFENDRRRDASLTARGFRVMRITWRQISGESEATLARLAQALSRD